MSLTSFDNVKITGFLSVVPEKHINIDDEIEFYGDDRKKLERNKRILGLGTRHVVPEGITASDLCEAAARRLLKETNTDVSEIDTLIMTSINHDYIGNSDACIIQSHLGLSEECACFDTCGLGCTDVIYGLWLAHSLIQSGASKKCLFLEGSTSSLISDKRNRHSNMLFGDAGGAVLLERTKDVRPAYFHLKSIGREWKKITTPAGGFRLSIRKDIIDLEIKDPEGNVLHLWDSIMKGGEIFKFAIEQAPETVQKVLDMAHKTREDIDFFAIHQANGQIVRTVINHANLPKEKASAEAFTTYGNCGGTSVLVDLCHHKSQNPQNVLMVSFGVGLSVASCVLDLKETLNGGVHLLETPENIPSREEQIRDWVAYLSSGNI